MGEYNKTFNFYVIWVPEAEEKEDRAKSYSNKKMDKKKVLKVVREKWHITYRAKTIEW